MREMLQQFWATQQYMPHGGCYLWQPSLVGLHLLSDALIALAYYSIPLMLLYFIRQRQDIPFKGIFILFSAFIVACGTTHVMGIITLWVPLYWISGSLKALTAIISVYTAISLWPVIPVALAVPSVAQLETANQSLAAEVDRRQQVETQLKGLNVTLEQRIDERTQALERSNQQQATLLAEAQSAQRQTQILEQRFRATFEQAAVGLAHVSREGQWIRVNQKLCQILGYPLEQLLQLTFQDITLPEDLDADLGYLRQLLAAEITTCCFEKRYLRADRSIVWAQVTVSSVVDASGQVDYFIVVIEDICDRKQAETELQTRAEEMLAMNSALLRSTTLLAQRNEELDQFAYVASHDLKAPLRAIANLSEWLEEDLEDALSEENQKQMQLLRNRVNRLENLIDGLLSYSRAGQRQEKTEAVNVADLVAEVVDALDPDSNFDVVIDTELPILQTHRLPLQQIFSNLISNALKYHDRQTGTITIGYQPEDQTFTVTDDGPGIAPEYQARIFTIFQTLQPRDKFESTGIGLAIVKKILDTEGGSIEVESAVGQGSTFKFRWPYPVM